MISMKLNFLLFEKFTIQGGIGEGKGGDEAPPLLQETPLEDRQLLRCERLGLK